MVKEENRQVLLFIFMRLPFWIVTVLAHFIVKFTSQGKNNQVSR